MCGVVGVVDLERRGRVERGLLERMRDTMTHRGPDGAGSWLSDDRSIGLGHRRLAIIDPDPAAAQPMRSDDGQTALVFNGEIYNHAELRRELQAQGVGPWRTDHSDTEVLLHGLRHWGLDLLDRLHGMFAFAWWDARTRELVLVRDRIGVKPIYYTQHDGKFAFASEIKALLEDPDQPRGIDERALYDYLSFLVPPAPSTLFRGIAKLPGGCLLRVSASGQVTQRRWYDVWDHVTPREGISEADAAGLVLETLKTSVASRKVSDVPVGVFLSGGVDSSTNAALFSAGEASPVKTFSIGYDDEYGTYKSELHHAERMAKEIGADHHALKLSVDDLLGFVDKMVWLQDEPIADPVCVPVHFVSKLAREHGVVVAQVGEGADELFCGYPHWQRALRLQGLSDRWYAGPLKRAGLAGLRTVGRGGKHYTEWLRRGVSGEPVFWSGAECFTEAAKRGLLSQGMRERFAGYSSWQSLSPMYDAFRAKAWEPSALHWMAHSDLHLRLPELLLMRVDKMAMGVSLEGRVPFLDHPFVELALSLPSSVKLGDGKTSKRVLKRAVRGVIPDALIDRPKQGFGVPVYEWCFDRLGDAVRAKVDRFADATGLVDRAAAAALLERGAGQPAWTLYNLALWWEKFLG
ncbi:MAG: asparagine synthase (glutamine-hydrolyzing) [Phycisphaerales bacterium JB063]